MLKKFTTAFAIICVIACNNQKASTGSMSSGKTENGTSVSDQEKQDGFNPLFDGTTLKGWHKYGGGAPGKGWKASEGTLMLDAAAKGDNDGGDLITDEEYSNFHLKYEWKIDTGGNSGVIFYIKEDPKFSYPFLTGPEMQVLDNERHSDAKIPKHRAGDLYDLIACSQETVKPALQWNYAEIRSLNGKLDFYLNGVNVVSTTMWNDEWNAMVAKSKFKAWKDFAIYKSGRIGLQDHGNTVWFRNIRIKKL